MRPKLSLALLVAAAAAAVPWLLACGSSSAQSAFQGGSGDDGGSSGDDGSSGGCLTCSDGGVVDASNDGALVLPANFVPTNFGGYALGPPLADGGTGTLPVNSGNGCSLVVGVVRDFKDVDEPGGGDEDFNNYCCGVTPNLVLPALGSGGKPQFAGICNSGNPDVSDTSVCPGGQMMSTQASFDQWYRNTPGVNLPYVVYLQFVPNGSVSTFEADGSHEYFPLDGAGWGNNYTVNGVPHNFGFTTELHLLFTYKGGETFSFTGDDDVWVFINGTLAVDIGGVHGAATKSVSLDTLGLTKGTQYPLDIFNAERHVVNSDFRVDTNLSFDGCGSIPPQ